LAEVRYNKSKAARLLNIDRKTLYLKMEKYNIQG
jgi:two-component system, NtrC family, response regulator HydG